MFLLKKPDDILPVLLGLCGLFLVYYCPLYTPEYLLQIPKLYIFDIIKIDIATIKLYVDNVNRIIIGCTLLYMLFLYHYYLESMTLIMSIFLIIHNIFYMAILANILSVPAVDFYGLLLLGISLWHSCFLMPKTVLSLGLSSLIFSVIAFINPVASICFGIALMITTYIIPVFTPKAESYFYNIVFIGLCGFCSLTVSLLHTQNVIGFSDIFEKNYHIPATIGMMQLIFIVCYQLNNKEYIKQLCLNSKAMLACYGLVTFLGAVFIGRFDYIAHFA